MDTNLSGAVNTTFDNNMNQPMLQKEANTWRSELSRSDGFISSHISPQQCKIRIYANLTKVSRPAKIMTGGGVRGKVSDFSQASRKRMLEYLAMIRNLKRVTFVTLTYPAAWENRADRWKRDLDVLLKRLHYHAPQSFGIWRIEPQQRGAPHFHLLISNHPWTLRKFRAWVKKAWYLIVNSGDEKHFYAGTQVDKVYSRKHAMWYVSKYAAKKSKMSHQFKTTEGEIINSIGKHWGIFNRAAADTEAFLELTITPREFVELRRLMSTWLTKRGSRYGKRLKHQHPKVGYAVFGLGDVTQGVHRTVMRMLLSVFDKDFTWQSTLSV